MTEYFTYFAYGSNLLKRRIRISNPSARFVSPGRLDGYKLDFMRFSPNWNGASATIIETFKKTDVVWGAIWTIHIDDLPGLDKQEGVDINWYFPKLVKVRTAEKKVYECRTYEQIDNPVITETLPPERQPSKTYMEVILAGAEECGLPDEYIAMLKTIPHNGQEASKEMLAKLKTMTKVYWDIPHLYFTYGSNMCSERILMHIPSAEFVSIGRIENNRLHFGKYSPAWGGPTATIVATANAHVWGVIYKLNKVDLLLLDRRKREQKDKYFSRAMKIHTPHMGIMSCRVFILNDNPVPRGDRDPIPVEQWPSKDYKSVLLEGAREHGIPQFYIDFIKSLKDNGHTGFLKMSRYLNLYRDRPTCQCRYVTKNNYLCY